MFPVLPQRAHGRNVGQNFLDKYWNYCYSFFFFKILPQAGTCPSAASLTSGPTPRWASLIQKGDGSAHEGSASQTGMPRELIVIDWFAITSSNHTVIVSSLGMLGKEKVTHYGNYPRKLGGIRIRPWNAFHGILLIKTFALLEIILYKAFE